MIEYVETKKEVQEPEEAFETTENSESDSETEESKNLEGTNKSTSNALSEKYWKNLGRKMPREIKRLQTYNNPGLIEKQEKAAHFVSL